MKPRKLTDQQVEEIKVLAKTSIKRVEIARRYGISPQLVSTVARYGYATRPSYLKKVKAGEEPDSWEQLAKTYNSKYPDEPPITAAQAQEIHDIALVKLARLLKHQNTKFEDLV